MKNFIQPGENLTFAAPYAVTAGAGALVGSVFGVAQSAAANGEEVVLLTEGVFEMAKATGQAWTVGLKLYWDNSAKNITSTASANTLVGAATAAALTGDTVGVVYLDGTIR
jgi:predicted RecA/RadA family phage recombinase